ncbi:MAG: RNA polymerase factor sigma-54 [Deltaproteobacteria bacterium]|nr:RNA polymerase factor sigma-54 [Deltaproteobacteria bacterium]
MQLDTRLNLKLTQKLVMTPQLQQAIKLLQLSKLELIQSIHQELVENPVLEEEAQELTEEEKGATLNKESEEDGKPERKEEDFDWQHYLKDSMGSGYEAYEPYSDNGETPSYENTLSRKPSLSEHLLWQLNLSHISDEEKMIAENIIGNLDGDGYLRVSETELETMTGAEAETIARALDLVQSLDPVGVGARDLQECLLLQVRQLDADLPLVEAMIKDYLPWLQKKDYAAIARKLEVTLEDVDTASRVIENLEPKPGRSFGGEDPVYIIPDIYVVRDENDFLILLNDDGLPRLRVSSFYRRMLKNKNQMNRSTAEYVEGKFKSALWLIRSIEQRQKTIYRTMESILKFQRDFFEKGPSRLKPMVLRDVAEDINMHESTISRVTTNKYVHTPHGIFELKYFFCSGLRTEDGTVSSISVQEQIRKIIMEEDRKKPLSDQKIVEILQKQGIDIARRTVTKYRIEQNILSTTERRRMIR